jgi:hypothetical protein
MVVLSDMVVLAPPFFEYCMPASGSETLIVPAVIASMVSGVASVTGSSAAAAGS